LAVSYFLEKAELLSSVWTFVIGNKLVGRHNGASSVMFWFNCLSQLFTYEPVFIGD